MPSTVTWATGVSDDWNTSSAWVGGIVPNSGSIDALINAASTSSYTVTIASGAADIADAVTLDNAAATLAVAGTLDFSSGTTRALNATQGMVQLNSGFITGAQTISGLVVGSGQFNGSATLVNNGTLQANGGTNVTLFVVQTMNNKGTLLAKNGFLGIEGFGITNLSGSTLTGGTYISQGFGTADNILAFGFNFDATLAVDAANIILDGAASEIEGYTGPTGVSDAFQPIEQQLQTIASGGTLQLLNNRGYTTTKSLKDDGVVVLQGGTLNNGSFTLGVTGALSGSGVVNGGIANQGVIVANGGALDLTTQVTGTGDFTVTSGSTLILNGATPTNLNNSGTVYDVSGLLDVTGLLSGKGTVVVQNGGTLEFAGTTAQNVAFSGSNATLKLDNFAGYSGTLAGFTQGDTIVLAGTSATKAFVSGSTLVVMNNSSTVDTIQLAGSYAPSASFSVANVGSNAVVSNISGAPFRQDFQFTILPVNDTVGLGSTEDAQIVADLNAAALDWSQYLTGHTTLRIQLNILPGTKGSELANASSTINISNSTTLDGRLLDIPSSLIALNTGNYAPDITSDITVNLLAGNLGSLYVNLTPTPTPIGSVPSGQIDLVTIFRHELAHGFGFGGLTDSTGSLGSQETLFDHFIQNIGGTIVFTGPSAEAAYGALLGTGTAMPVPLTTLANREAFAHFANSTLDVNATDLMSGLGLPPATQRDISLMDLAVLQDIGAPVTVGVQPAAPVPRTLGWTGLSSSNFATAQNWNDSTNGLNPAAAAPGSIDAAQFTSGGGTITGTGTAATLLFLGANAWTVTSSASLVTAGGVNVGTTGTGTLTVNGTASITSQGTADIISGAAGNAALATVSGKGSAWNSTGELTVGDQGTGTLIVTKQATVGATAQPSLDAAVLGASLGGEGWLQVTGTASAFTALGQLDVGQSGTGHLLVENQGTVRTGGNAAVDASQGFDIAQAAGGAGDVTVTGSKSLLSNTGRFVVGGFGFGILLIESGGTVVTTPGTVAGLAGAVVAAQGGSDGSGVSVTGAGSDWQITGKLAVGNAAAGSLAITAGGTVTAGQMDEGVLAGGSGIVSVVGVGSNLTLAGQLTIGDAASGELLILNNATVNAANVDIGLQANGTGNVDIEGPGSLLNIANDLNIGETGVGVLTLGNNTELTVVNNLNIGANGVLNQFGGIIDPSVVNNTGRAGGKGAITATVSIVNTGTLFAASGTETLVAPVITGTGVLEIDTKGNLTINVGSVAATQTVTFTDGTGILTIGTLGGFGATIGDFITGDAIIVQGTSIASDSFDVSTHVLTLFDGSSTTIGTLQFGASVTGSNLVVNASGSIGTAPCFVAGTRISTERGEVAVEHLREGDRVQVVQRALSHPLPNPPPLRGRGSIVPSSAPPLPRSGGGLGRGLAQPVIWIGHRTVNCARHPEPRKVWPVRIAAGAFGPGRPFHDLWLSPDHALYINDVLIPVKHLINGSSIEQVPMDEVTYYHVELREHAVLLAEGLPAESYLDTGDRSNFVNGGGPIPLYPDFASRVWEAEGCAQLVVTGPELDAARRWVNGLARCTVPSTPLAMGLKHTLVSAA